VLKTVSGTGIQTFDWLTSFNASSTNGAYYSVMCDLGASDFGESLYWTETTATTTTDTKTMPAIAGKAGAIFYELQRGAFGLWGSSPNTYGDYLVQFPILRDQFSTSKTLSSLSLRMYRGNANFLSTCGATVTDNYFNWLKDVPRSANNMGNNTLSWGTSLNVAFVSGYYNIECNLSQDDEAFSYSWGE
jgi:hypothetical protein